MKAASTRRLISDLVIEAVQRTLREDEKDCTAFQARAQEPRPEVC